MLQRTLTPHGLFFRSLEACCAAVALRLAPAFVPASFGLQSSAGSRFSLGPPGPGGWVGRGILLSFRFFRFWFLAGLGIKPGGVSKQGLLDSFGDDCGTSGLPEIRHLEAVCFVCISN